MGLTMSKKLVLIALLCYSCCLRSVAQDSTWYYANTLTDYATADLAGLLRVVATDILDTTGGYSVQEVSFEPLIFYKGAGRPKKFRAWLESHEPVWKAGTIHGYYLIQDKQEPGSDMYYWLENAGFTLSDTAFIAKLADTGHFKKMVAQYILSEIAGSWAKVTLLQLGGDKNEAYGPMDASIRLEEAVPALHLQKGQSISVRIWNDAYIDKQALISRFHKKETWEVVLYREDGQLNMKTIFMLERN